MSQNLDQIQAAIKEYQEVLLCKRRLVIVTSELHQQDISLSRLKLIVEKEHQDVKVLENLSLKQLFSVLLLNKEAQLEKERQEYLMAALNYNECHNLVELLTYEKGVLKAKLKTEAQTISSLETALDDFSLNKRQPGQEEIEALKAINQEIKDIVGLNIEVKEALDVIKDLKKSFEKVLGYLKSATLYDNWGQFYQQKQLAKEKKKQYIDQAQSMVYIVRKQLIFLRSELLDVEEFQGAFTEAKGMINDFNMAYYQDLITDWINVLKLDETIAHTLTTMATIIKLGKMLKKMIKDSDKEYDGLLKKRAEMVEQIAG